jgi:HK97 family phage portal protein
MKFWPFATAAVETKSLSSPTETELAIFTGSAVATGDPLDNDVAYAAVSLICNAVSCLEINVERRGRGREPVDHPAVDLLRNQVNPWLDGAAFIRDITAQALSVDAGGIAVVIRNGEGKPVEIILYDSGRATVQRDPMGTGELTFRLNGNLLNPVDVIHLRGLTTRCPLSRARNAIAAGQALERQVINLFQKGARPGGAIEVPDKIGEDAIKRLKAGWKAANEGVDNSGKTAILYAGAKYTPFTLSSVDAQLLELRKFQVESVARYFNLPPSMVGDQTKSSYSKGSQGQLEALIYAIEPWLVGLENALNRALLSDDERKTLTFRFQRDDLTRASLTERANAINSLRASQVLSPNEGREWLGLPDRAGGDTFDNPNITVKPVPDPAAAGAPSGE